jgi:hypothetical protein
LAQSLPTTEGISIPFIRAAIAPMLAQAWQMPRGNRMRLRSTALATGSTSTPPNGGTVQLSYTLDYYISGQRSIPVAATPMCQEEGTQYPHGQQTGTLNETAFLQRLRDSSAGDWRTAHSHCGNHVRQALCAGGLQVFCDSNPNRPRQARLYAGWLSSLGWSKVYEGSDANGWCKRIGDVAVFTYAEDPTGDGHTGAWDGEYWRSDHRQNSVYPRQTVPRPFTVWRRPGVDPC